MSLLTKKRTILGKIETTYGVDPTPTGAANAVLVRNVTPNAQLAEMLNRDFVRPYLGNSGKVVANIHTGIDFEIELAGAGTAGTVPAYGFLLRACGFSETVNAGIDVTYVPVSSGFESTTLYFNVDGVLHKLTGARGTLALDMNSNQIPVMKFKFQGIYNDVVDAAAPTVTLTAWQTPLSCGKVNTPTFNLHGVAPVLSTLSLDMANSAVFRSLIGAQDVRITDRQPSGQAVIEAGTVAFKDWWTAAKTAALNSLQIIHGTTAGNIVEINAPKVQVTNPQYQDLQGTQMLQMGLSIQPTTAGNDEISIKIR